MVSSGHDTYDNAVLNCQLLGGTLPIIHNAQVQAAIVRQYFFTCYAHFYSLQYIITNGCIENFTKVLLKYILNCRTCVPGGPRLFVVHRLEASNWPHFRLERRLERRLYIMAIGTAGQRSRTELRLQLCSDRTDWLARRPLHRYSPLYLHVQS